jgi:RHS repeat-associated protein
MPPLVAGPINCERAIPKWMTAIAKSLAVFCFLAVCCLYSLTSLADAPLMALSGQMNVDPMGAFTYSVPIQAPPGTNGMVPHIALTYSSSRGDGYVGVGWAISGLSTITRCGQTIAQDGRTGGVDYGPDDRFCLDGQRLILVNGTYGVGGSEYRTEIETFRKIVFSTSGTNCGISCFDVWAKDGTHYQYGYTQNGYTQNSNAQVLVYGNSSIVRLWAISQATDTKGNYIAYTYYSISNFLDYVPIRIDYTGNLSGSAPYNSIRFVYAAGARPGASSKYQAGYQYKPEKLLTDVETYHLNAQLVRDYQLTYDQVGGSKPVSYNELNAITLCDYSSPTQQCIAPMTFGWQGSGTALTWDIQSTNNIVDAGEGQTVLPANFEGIGITDFLLVWPGAGDNYFCGPNNAGTVYFGSRSNPGTFTQQTGMKATYDYWPYQDTGNPDRYNNATACFQNQTRPSGANVPQVGDVTGSGISQIVLHGGPWWETQTGFWLQDYDSQFVALSGTSWTQFADNYETAYSNPLLALHQGTLLAGDFNGDSLADAFFCSSTCNAWFSKGDGTFQEDNSHTYPGQGLVADFDGDGCDDILSGVTTLTVTYSCDPAAASATLNVGSSDKIVLGDFNGDHKTDILDLSPSGNATLYLSTGAGFAAGQSINGSSSWYSAYAVAAGDWNGDGKDDLVVVNNTTATVYLSTGTGAANNFVAQSPTVSVSPSSSPIVADWNNDGAADVWLQSGSEGGLATEVLFNYTPQLMISVANGLGATTTVAYHRLNDATMYTKGSGAAYPMRDVDSALYAVYEIQTSGGNTSKSWNYAYTGLEEDLHGHGFLGFQQVAVTDNQTHIVRTINYGTGGAIGMQFPWNTVVTSDSVVASGVTLSSVSSTWYVNPTSVCQNLNATKNYVVCLEKTVASGQEVGGTYSWPTTTTTYGYDGYGNILSRNVSVANGSDTFQSTTTNTFNYDQYNGDWGIMNEPATSQVQNAYSGSNITRNYAFYEGNGNTGEITEADIEPSHTSDPQWLQMTYTYDGWGNVASTTYGGWNLPQRTSSVQYDTTYGEFPILTTNALYQTETPTYAQYFGGLAVLKDLNSNTTTISYDTFGHPITLTRVDGTTANVTYDYCNGWNNNQRQSPYTCPQLAAFVVITTYLGAPVSGTAIQNQPTTLVFYDALGRVIAQDVQAFDGNWNQTDTEYDPNGFLAATSQPYEIATLSAYQCPTGVPCTTYQNDILGRVLNATYPNDNGGNSTITYKYEALTTIVTNDLGQATTTTKNAMGVVGAVMDANGQTTSYGYDAFGDLLTVGTPNNAGQILSHYDLRGRKTDSTDLDMGYWQYGYDSLGELISQISPVENGQGNATLLGYDALGRLTSRTEPDMTSNWEYDKAANGVGLLDKATCAPTVPPVTVCAGGNYTRTYTYDGFSRPSKLTIDYGSLGSYWSTQIYDGIANGGMGTEKVTTVTTFSGFQYTNGYNSTGYLSHITDANSGAVYWTANTMDAYQHLTQETAGNGVVTNRSYWPASGRIEQVNAETNGQPNTISNLSYTWDTIGNLLVRDDTLNGVLENFCYLDNAANTVNVLNRLSNYSVNSTGGSCSTGSNAKAVSYDNDGDITSKSDVGAYSYGNGAGPHALTSIVTNSGVQVAGAANPNFVYDANGNMVCVTTGGGCGPHTVRSYGYTSFNMVESIAQANNTTSLSYDPEHNRGAMTNASGSTTWYLNNPAAGVRTEVLQGTTFTWRDYLMPYGHIVAERFAYGSTVTLSYFIGDHLLSTTALTDSNETSQEYDSYDSWGKRRNSNGSDINNCLTTHPSSLTLRGYTGQEMMDSLCLINLNARIYDPQIGRVLSADPTVPGPGNGQAYNRYSYVLNNPLALSDPSGYAGTAQDGVASEPPVWTYDGDSSMPPWGMGGAGYTSNAADLPEAAADFGAGGQWTVTDNVPGAASTTSTYSSLGALLNALNAILASSAAQTLSFEMPGGTFTNTLGDSSGLGESSYTDPGTNIETVPVVAARSTWSFSSSGSFNNGVYYGGLGPTSIAANSPFEFDLYIRNWQVTFSPQAMQHVLQRHAYGRPNPAVGQYDQALSNPTAMLGIAALTIDLGTIVGSGNVPNSIMMQYDFPSNIGETGNYGGQSIPTFTNTIILQPTGSNSYSVITQYPSN